MTLHKSEERIVYKVTSINGNNETTKHLSNIGLEVGDEIYIISKIAGNYIVNIKGARFCMDKKMASLIEVSL